MQHLCRLAKAAQRQHHRLDDRAHPWLAQVLHQAVEVRVLALDQYLFSVVRLPGDFSAPRRITIVLLQLCP